MANPLDEFNLEGYFASQESPVMSEREIISQLLTDRDRPKSWNPFGDTEAFKNQMQDFYDASGISGANKSFANVFGFGEHVQNANEAAERARQTNPQATQYGELFGNIVSSLPFFSAAGIAAPLIPGLGAAIPITTQAALGGAAHGFVKNPEKGESRLENALMEGAMSAALPAAGAALKGGGKLLGKAVEAAVPASLSQAKTVKEAAKMTRGFREHFKEGYNKILSDSALPAKSAPQLSQRSAMNYVKNAPKHSDKVTKALQTQSPKDLHDAASQIGKYIAKESKKLQPNEKGLRAAELVKDRFERAINKALEAKPGLKDAYRALDAEYESTIGRMHPHIQNALRRFDKNKIGYEDVMRRIQSPTMGEEFRHRFIEELPGIKSAQHPEAYKNLPLINSVMSLLKKGKGF